ncbi:MAG: DUF4394 domain-containing protein, partial [Actinomycetota bacterium]|nr:DUF4394 domain-containing protein [Actinomycetota bacterium]
MLRSILLLASLAALALAAPAAAAGPGTVGVALSGNSLVTFDPQDPAAAAAPVAVANLAAGDQLVGIDFRPNTGTLYALGFNGANGTIQLYVVDHRTGFAAPLAAPAKLAQPDGTPLNVAGTGFGFDFNPAVDRIRVVTNTGQNFRVNPNTGLILDADGGAAGNQPDQPINGATTSVDGSAYTNNRQNAAATTLFALSAATDSLYVQNPSNAGTLTTPKPVTLNGATLDFAAAGGFDVAPGVEVAASNTVPAGSAHAALTVGGTAGLYTIDLATGAATLVGPIGNTGGAVRGLAIQGEVVEGGHPAIGLLPDAHAVTRFTTGAPGDAQSTALTGVVAGEEV